ncbi:hypothetical protein MES4922_10301 [Mesorhizobium ventifaucium]|uniref:Toxin SymE-like domain-containing protein n=1 Tax=Mesorhizobium ventifaucium TaxID=666020 RepID=A0ABN8JAW8_9HYPH|nr:hypothetical protein MES4922_10301 [Mesorhizobium ventifaucium]
MFDLSHLPRGRAQGRAYCNWLRPARRGDTAERIILDGDWMNKAAKSGPGAAIGSEVSFSIRGQLLLNNQSPQSISSMRGTCNSW